jgi:hypothetical protein
MDMYLLFAVNLPDYYFATEIADEHTDPRPHQAC